MYSPDSIELLQKSGIDLQRHEEMGIEPNDFAELMITSGLVLVEDTKWISFHRSVLVFRGPALDARGSRRLRMNPEYSSRSSVVIVRS